MNCLKNRRDKFYFNFYYGPTDYVTLKKLDGDLELLYNGMGYFWMDK